MKKVVCLLIVAVLVMYGNICYAADVIVGNNVEITTGTASGTEADNAAPLAAGDVEINETNFPDANFRKYLLSQLPRGYGSDGILTETEIADITYLNVSALSISDLTGIEHFTALKSLNCRDNALTTLDISGNIALTDIDCRNNNLATLDVSKNTELSQLMCSNNNLTALDVSKNTKLHWFECVDNALTTLDVSKSIGLAFLRCNNNNLTALDVSNNTALYWLECDDNALTTLDVSKDTALTHLACFSNNLTVLDVSKNTALTDLGCGSNNLTALDVSNNTALTYLACSSNNLTALDVSKNTALTYLLCSSDNLTVLDVSKNTALTELHCDNNNLTALDVSKNTVLTRLSCSSNNLTALDVSNNTALTEIGCHNNSIQNLKLPTGEELIVQIAPLKGGQIRLSYFDYNSRQTIYQATPYDGYTFDGWTGDAAGAEAYISFVLSENMTVTANFDGNAQAPDITEQPQDKTVDAGDLVSLHVSAAVSDGGTLSYQWYSSTQDSTTGGTLIPDATSDIYVPPTNTAGTTYYYVVITNTNNNKINKTAVVTSNAAAVTVQDVPMNAEDILNEAENLSPDDPEYASKIEELEDIYKDAANVSVNVTADPNTHGNFKNNIDAIKVTGAALNAGPDETVTLHFSKPANNVVIDGERYKTNSAVQMDIKLLNNDVPMENLKIPVTITVPIPTGIAEKDFWILHYHNDGTLEVIQPTLNGDGTCSFTVNSFSVFVFVNSVEANENDSNAAEGPASDNTDANTASTALQSGLKAPKTGDETNIIIWMIAASMSTIAIIIMLLHQKFNDNMR